MRLIVTYEVQATVDDETKAAELEQELNAAAKKHGTDIDVTETDCEEEDED